MADYIGFIGAGNMGGAIAGAVAKKFGGENIYISSKSYDSAKKIADKICGKAATNEYVAKNCDYIFLGVKPQIIMSVLEEIREFIVDRPEVVLVSMAAGVTISAIEDAIDAPVSVVRIMPNTPVALGKGIVVYCGNSHISQDKLSFVSDILSEAGLVDMIDESLMDAATSVAGCGPAFAYMYIDAFKRAGENIGLDEEKASLYAKKMIEGAAALAIASDKSIIELRNDVCSKGGSTIEGVKVLENSQLFDIVNEAVKASFDRNKELGK